jgi:hypothetical protein
MISAETFWITGLCLTMLAEVELLLVNGEVARIFTFFHFCRGEKGEILSN